MRTKEDRKEKNSLIKRDSLYICKLLRSLEPTTIISGVIQNQILYRFYNYQRGLTRSLLSASMDLIKLSPYSVLASNLSEVKLGSKLIYLLLYPT
jgi:hypothetical protein